MSAHNPYETEQVRQTGSVVLAKWNAERQSIRAENAIQQNLSAQELANIISGGGTNNGPVVNETTAMRVSAVYAGVSLIAGAISTLPASIYERTPAGRDNAEHDYWWLLNERPNPEMTAAVFWEYLAAANLFCGDAFAEILRPSFRSAAISGFMPHHPHRVHPFRAANRQVYYRVQPEEGPAYVLNAADMIHIPSLGFDGLRSPSPITYAARQAVSTALSAGEYSGRFFSNGARPDFALTTAGKLDKDQAELLRATWMERHSGPHNAHLPAILTGGLDVKQLSLSAEDSQILATSLFQIEEIARVLGVPPHMIGHTDKTSSWGSGVENMGRGFTRFTLNRHLVKYQQEFNSKMWPVRTRYFMEFNVAGLERGDLKSENESLRIALGRAGEPGWMTQNEVRRIKNLPPDPDGGKLFSGLKNAITDKTADQQP